MTIKYYIQQNTPTHFRIVYLFSARPVLHSEVTAQKSSLLTFTPPWPSLFSHSFLPTGTTRLPPSPL